MPIHLPPVVLCRPVAYEPLHRCELHALELISDSLPVQPLCRRHASAGVDECLFRDVDAEGADCAILGGENGLGVAGGGERGKADCTHGCRCGK